VWTDRFSYCSDIRIKRKIIQTSTHFITKYFDLTVSSVRNCCITRILKCVDLNVQRKTLEGGEGEVQ
jgi:hypothetical protein